MPPQKRNDSINAMHPATIDLQMPKQPATIYVVGAGGIVKDGHLPAYQKAGFAIAGIFDLDTNRATALAEKFDIKKVYRSLEAMLAEAPDNIVFDIAVPSAYTYKVLKQLPDCATVLMQKPLGENYTEAKEIAQLVTDKKLIAGVNFQLRYAPVIMAARQILTEGKIGQLIDIEVNVNVYTPWHLWQFLFTAPRVEILYHSIHYIDLVRSFLCNPTSVMAKTIRHPQATELASVRSNIIMDYGNQVRANILTNHYHHFGSKHQQSYIKLEGTAGAIWIEMDCLKSYPHGEPGWLEYISLKDGENAQWQRITPQGSWFPDAFMHSMAQVMLAKEETIDKPDNSVEDCLYTMACVEAAYQSSEKGGVKLAEI